MARRDSTDRSTAGRPSSSRRSSARTCSAPIRSPPEALHDRMLRVNRHGRAGLFVNAVSVVDNALWDLRGKVVGEPVYRLLGGPTRERVPVYASMLGSSIEPDRAAEAAAEHQALGFGAQKWFFAFGPGAGWEGLQRNLAMARAVREAVGAGYPLMFDAFMGWDATYAADMLRGLEPVEPHWVEEPVPPERVDVFRRLAARHVDPAGDRGARRHAMADQAAARRGRRRDPGRPRLVGRDHRAAAHLLAVFRLRRARGRPRARDPGAAAHRGVAVAAGGPDDGVPRADPGAQPVVPPDDPVARSTGRSSCPIGPGLGIELDPAKIDKQREVAFED